MQDFQYNFNKNKYGHKASQIFATIKLYNNIIDTDSLMFKIKAENIYEDFYKDKELLDFSNYSKDSKYYNDTKNSRN